MSFWNVSVKFSISLSLKILRLQRIVGIWDSAVFRTYDDQKPSECWKMGLLELRRLRFSSIQRLLARITSQPYALRWKEFPVRHPTQMTRRARWFQWAQVLECLQPLTRPVRRIYARRRAHGFRVIQSLCYRSQRRGR